MGLLQAFSFAAGESGTIHCDCIFSPSYQPAGARHLKWGVAVTPRWLSWRVHPGLVSKTPLNDEVRRFGMCRLKRAGLSVVLPARFVFLFCADGGEFKATCCVALLKMLSHSRLKTRIPVLERIAFPEPAHFICRQFNITIKDPLVSIII